MAIGPAHDGVEPPDDESDRLLEKRLVAAALQNPINLTLLERLAHSGLPDAWLAAGCVYQAVWNQRIGLPADRAIKDYDVFYFDPTDRSYEAEDVVIQRFAAMTSDLAGVDIEVRNQARTHLWYPQRFGTPYAPSQSARDGIGRFLVTCTCVGLQQSHDGRIIAHAPYGLRDLFAGQLCPNPRQVHPERYAEKVASYRQRWPFLTER